MKRLKPGQALLETSPATNGAIPKRRKKGFFSEIIKNRWLYALVLPAILYSLIFSYLPMSGLVMAFQKYNPIKGIFGSEFVWFDNFKYFFRGSRWTQITFNTLFLNAVFIISGTIASIAIAIIITQLGKNWFVKLNQTIMIFPNFISFAVIAMFAQVFLSSDSGIINQIIRAFNGNEISFYTTPTVWPIVFVIIRIWKGAGFGAIIYIATIVGMDSGVFEAARIDGASRMQCIFRITIPMLKDTIILLTLFAVGKIFYGEFSLIYTLVGDNSMLFSTTDIIDTYVFRSMRTSSSVGMSAAAGLYQSFMGFLLVIVTNRLARKFSPESAIY